MTRPDLAMARAARPLDEEDCRIHFGVGLTTIERVEAGEIEPDAELEQRIDRFLGSCGAPIQSNRGASPGGAPIQSNRGAR